MRYESEYNLNTIIQVSNHICDCTTCGRAVDGFIANFHLDEYGFVMICQFCLVIATEKVIKENVQLDNQQDTSIGKHFDSQAIRNKINEAEIVINQCLYDRLAVTLLKDNDPKIDDGKLMCLCPFHKEKTPSFMIDGEKYYCFGCGRKGDTDSLEKILEGRKLYIVRGGEI
jgi:CHC2 zinc finger